MLNLPIPSHDEGPPSSLSCYCNYYPDEDVGVGSWYRAPHCQSSCPNPLVSYRAYLSTYRRRKHAGRLPRYMSGWIAFSGADFLVCEEGLYVIRHPTSREVLFRRTFTSSMISHNIRVWRVNCFDHDTAEPTASTAHCRHIEQLLGTYRVPSWRGIRWNVVSRPLPNPTRIGYNILREGEVIYSVVFHGGPSLDDSLFHIEPLRQPY